MRNKIGAKKFKHTKQVLVSQRSNEWAADRDADAIKALAMEIACLGISRTRGVIGPERGIYRTVG